MDSASLKEIRAVAHEYEQRIGDPAQAEAVARGALRKCRKNLERLHHRLQQEGYPLVRGVLPRATTELLDRAREVLGSTPPRLLELFWEEVGGIELVSYEGPNAVEPPHAKFFKTRGIVSRGPDRTTDAMVVDGLSDDWISYLAGELEAYREELEELEKEAEELGLPPPAFLIPLSPDHLHKENISGGGPYAIALGDDDWRPSFGGEFAWVGSQRPTLASWNPDLMSYLRSAVLECAGFPGLLGTESFEPLRESLLRDLEPF